SLASFRQLRQADDGERPKRRRSDLEPAGGLYPAGRPIHRGLLIGKVGEGRSKVGGPAGPVLPEPISGFLRVPWQKCPFPGTPHDGLPAMAGVAYARKAVREGLVQ